MRLHPAIPLLAALLALPSAASVAGAVLLPPWLQGKEGRELSPLEQEQPLPARGSAPLLALWGVSPYAELQEAGLPLPPSPQEVAAVPGLQFAREQLALKRVLLSRTLRARAERNRISRGNCLACAAQARGLGAPAAFVALLERRADETLSRPQRHLVDTALSLLLRLYRVDEAGIRFFVESRALPSAVEAAADDWFPLPLLFNVESPAALSSEALGAHDLAMLSALGELASLYAAVQDEAGADAAAAAMPHLLARFRSSMQALAQAPAELRAHVRARYASLAARVEAAWHAQRRRVVGAGYYGSERLRALDYFMD